MANDNEGLKVEKTNLIYEGTDKFWMKVYILIFGGVIIITGVLSYQEGNFIPPESYIIAGLSFLLSIVLINQSKSNIAQNIKK